MDWATNIVRLPIEPSAAADLRQQMHEFPPPFLLFVEHVGQLTIDDGSTLQRVLELEEADGEFRLVDGGAASAWKLFKVIHRLSSDARADRRSLDDGDEVPIWWGRAACSVDRSRRLLGVLSHEDREPRRRHPERAVEDERRSPRTCCRDRTTMRWSTRLPR